MTVLVAYILNLTAQSSGGLGAHTALAWLGSSELVGGAGGEEV